MTDKPSREGFIMGCLLVILAVVILEVAAWPGYLLAAAPLVFAMLIFLRALDHRRAGH